MNRYLLIILLLWTCGCKTSTYLLSDSDSDNIYTVTRIVDGDTFHGVDKQGKDRTFRPIGLDTPETGKRKGEPELFHEEATAFTTALLLGKKIKVVYDIESQDYWKRDLVYVYLLDGTFFNYEIVLAGWAVVATFPPNIAHEAEFVKAQRIARNKKVGMYKD